jgi:hypothetical protein
VLGIAVDPSGRLWVTRTTDGIGPGVIDILSAEGAYEGTLNLPEMAVAFVSDTSFVGVRLRETGLPTATLYTLRDTAARAASR